MHTDNAPQPTWQALRHRPRFCGPLGMRNSGSIDMTKFIGVLLGLGLLATPVLLPAAPDPLEACYQLPDGAPRLACFNREMQRRHSGGANAPATHSSGTSVTTASAPDEREAASNATKPARVQRQRPLRPAERPSVVAARIARLLPQSHGEYLFELDNGQTWEQTEYVEHLYLRPQQSVQIVPGMFGSYFLTTAHGPRVRVRRTR